MNVGMEMITNNTSRTSKLIKSLMLKKNRDKLNLFIAEGLRFVSEIPESVYIEFYVYTDAFISKNCNFEFRENVYRHLCSEKAFLDFSETASPQGILAVCRKICYDRKRLMDNNAKGTYIILEGLKDPGNLGTIIRTACAAGVKAIFLTKNTIDLYNPKVLRSTMGSIFNVPVIQNLCMEELLEALKTKGIPIIGTSPRANVNYYDADLEKHAAIIIGSEDSGMSKKAEKYCDILIKIPMEGEAESLNAAVAASILMYEAFRQRNVRRTDVSGKTYI